MVHRLVVSSWSPADMTEEVLLYQGAEGKVFTTCLMDKKVVIKERLRKKYRVPELDAKINKQRLLQEVRCNAKCRRAGIPTPTIYDVDMSTLRIIYEFIDGPSVKEYIISTVDNEKLMIMARAIGCAIGKMHDIEIVHGDLTTSNLMIRESHSEEGIWSPQILIIDFGLGMTKPVIEDKAVDLYVLERAFLSTHPGSEHLVNEVLDAYRFSNRKGGPILHRLEQVRQRGRKREMIG